MDKAEDFIKEHTRNCSNEYLGDSKIVGYGGTITKLCFTPWLTPEEARKAVEIAREEIYEWLRVNLCNYFDAPREDYDMCINDLKQEMKDEQGRRKGRESISKSNKGY